MMSEPIAGGGNSERVATRIGLAQHNGAVRPSVQAERVATRIGLAQHNGESKVDADTICDKSGNKTWRKCSYSSQNV